MTVLLLLLSMSIAFGVAYINLPGSRYRARLHDRIVASIRARTGDNGSTPLRQSDGYDQRLGDNEAFSKAHYIVTKWVGELPPETLSKHGDAIARLFDDTPKASAEKGGRPSRLYIYFTRT